jgi:hypothetical protein
MFPMMCCVLSRATGHRELMRNEDNGPMGHGNRIGLDFPPEQVFSEALLYHYFQPYRSYKERQKERKAK